MPWLLFTPLLAAGALFFWLSGPAPPLPQARAAIQVDPVPEVVRPPYKSEDYRRQKIKERWLMPLAERQRRLWPLIRRYARQMGLDPALVMAVVHVESKFLPAAISNRGAIGLMQLTPLTARQLGLEDPLDLEANLEAGTRYLAQLKRYFQDDLVLTLAAYNAGPTRVEKEGRVPDIEETQDFVIQVLGQVDYFRQRFQSLAKG